MSNLFTIIFEVKMVSTSLTIAIILPSVIPVDGFVELERAAFCRSGELVNEILKLGLPV